MLTIQGSIQKYLIDRAEQSARPGGGGGGGRSLLNIKKSHMFTTIANVVRRKYDFNYGVKRMVMYAECNLITFNELLSRLRVHRVVLIMLMSC